MSGLLTRGVISPGGSIRKTPDGGFAVKADFLPEHMRYYALYWDRVVIPASRNVWLGVPDEELLVQSGVIERPLLPSHGGFGPQMVGRVLQEQERLAKDLIENEPETEWVLHQIGDDVALTNWGAMQQALIRVSIANALPVPGPEVPDTRMCSISKIGAQPSFLRSTSSWTSSTSKSSILPTRA